jgi:hypothetical protein
MESMTEMQVSALVCADCGALSERPQARCQGHSVSVVTFTKRFFKCGGCGGRTSTLGKHMPGWGCDRCKRNAWTDCSMYSKRRVRALQMHCVFGHVALTSHVPACKPSACTDCSMYGKRRVRAPLPHRVWYVGRGASAPACMRKAWLGF